MVWILIGIGIAAWVIQGIFGFLQVKNFNAELKNLRKSGKVAIGRSRGKLRAGCLVMLCIDDELKIIKGRKLEGVTSFARFRDFNILNGIFLTDISPELCEALKMDKQLTKATLGALNDYIEFKKQQESPEGICCSNA